MNIITGEKIQQLCHIYLGSQADFDFNPIISMQKSKHVFLNDINNNYNNSENSIIFCYSHNIYLLSEKIHFFQNNFILVTHNSDTNIKENKEIYTILNCKKVLKWYGQNICFEHPKLHFLPIGLANSQWEHGKFDSINFMENNPKSNNIYFNFNINTNVNKRQVCYDNLINKLEWINNIHPIDNLKRLSTYKFCICSEGNGVDTHRLWECLYLKVVPIVIKSEFTNILLKQNIPLLVLDNWNDLNISELNYNNFNFDNFKLFVDKIFDNFNNNFNFNNFNFDIVIPVGPNDEAVIQNQIIYTKKNIIGYRYIYLICCNSIYTKFFKKELQIELQIEDCIIIPEDIFPFNIQTVANYHGKSERNGWYLQQLLKLYAGIIISNISNISNIPNIPNILDKYLVIDSDTFFLKPTTFVSENANKEIKCLYNYGTEYHLPYFNHMKKLNDTFVKQIDDKSGICHHMIFETKYIKEIFKLVEHNDIKLAEHNDTFYNIFLKLVDVNENSGASEYELYFNYMILNHPDKIQLRELNWINSNILDLTSNYDYISYHWYMRLH